MKKQTVIKHLFSAARTGNTDLLLNLTAAGEYINAKNIYGYTPLTTAIVNSYAECADLLVKMGADIHIKDKWNTPLLCLACNTPSCIKILLEAGADPNTGDPYGDSPLHYAAEAGQPECIKLLLDAGADPNIANDSGNTPLHRAAGKNAEATLILIKAGADLHAVNTEGEIALHRASLKGMWESFMHLINAGADPFASDNCGNTVLFRSATGGSAECIKYMLDHGADPNKANMYGRTALFEAAGRSAECTGLLIDAGADINARDRLKQTPVFKAVNDKKGPECLKLLLKYGADIGALDVDGRNVLHWATIKAPDKVQVLIKAGVKIDLADCEGNTPLHLAASSGHVAAMRFLIKAGADLFAEDPKGELLPPIEILKRRHPNIYFQKIDSILELAEAPERNRLKEEDKNKADRTNFEFDI